MISATTVKAKVDWALAKFRCPGILVSKYLGKQVVTPNPYDYGVATYAPAIDVVGRAIVNPTYEVVSKYGGNDKTYDIICVFSVIELTKKFGTVEYFTWITTSDVVSYQGNRYTLSLVKPTGIVFGEPTEVVCFGETLLGNSLVGP